ncbi:LCP family protein [Demequina sp. SYSU T00192]|uniref:LCP family protein n=1 Tax=Demequina litoralis TaxID=3051660 RepID=A0ABT8G6C5_9MICO|nr:LCP family protein [Demequina sp. SYSU T00192]MDN4474701.1 LCP family protein [Demequina sp. SYSU T00192]
MTDDRDGTSGAGNPPRRMPPSIQPRSGQERPGTARPAQPVRRESVRPQPAPERPSTRQPQQQAYSTPPGQQRPASSTRPQEAPPAQPPAAPAPAKRRKKRHPVRNTLIALLLILAIAVTAFYFWVDSRINHVDALSGANGTPGLTVLIVGSDSREGWDDDGTEGARTDTIMVLHKPESGPTALISIPRDSYVEIPGYDPNKINASFAFGGPQLLVETVEGVTNLTIDRYLEVGFTGVGEIVDALGGVELCYDQDVDDKLSRLKWKAGCHVADGDKALAFSRMRYSDPLGDIGRTQRQQQVVGAVADEIMSPTTLLNPFELVPVVSAGLDAFRVDEDASPFDLAQVALAFNSALGGDAVTGTPPIASMGYSVAGVGSTVLLDPEQEDKFWRKIANGKFKPGAEVGGVE